ncbi:S1 family peptidase [Actinosynnema mirum]|uniref:Novel STAND NTPase 1 domain-containing protein n=1 Tax=Actinosynnema mirum (strain ATCC 29888 / DSM 43827 / JCM 3225 / NBRC 14064 / NCIMB 13271 / NRRL B-12336 / IMRU 3971 / 101) TaxID=446462 RepID=C6W815_ACTMD|nr:serine protease [Actinosynnema mirum]ACU37036.1 hypothetical protein Amir_3123 [Actinosynnema mirum DSM 43827]
MPASEPFDVGGPGSPGAGLLRISTHSGQPVGLGFLITDRVALTCAHVLASALGGHPSAGSPVVVDLPLLTTGAPLAGRVEWCSPPDGDDLALLVVDAAPPGARPLRLVRVDEPWGRPVRVFGLPAGRPGGVWHSGVLRERQADGWVQVDLVGEGYRISPGFSGGPVWDEESAGVVGVVVAAEARTPPVGYLVPTSAVLDARPDLRPLVLPSSPFRGLRPFTEADAALFRGRRAESAEVADLVGTRRWTTLVGPSGCGKSSLVLAGVLPRRRAAGDLPAVLRPGHHASPVHALAAALAPLLEPGLEGARLITETASLARVLAGDGLRALAPPLLERHGADRLLVVVDQCEELLALPPAEVDALAEALFGDRVPQEVAVLCALRADFLEPALAHPRLGPVLGRRVHALAPMRADQLREVVTGAVDGTPGVRYQPNLADRVLADAGDGPGALPLLGFTLALLWERQERGVLTHHAYDGIGGVAGALGGYAEAAWARVEDDPAAERLLTRLVRLPLGAPAATRRAVPRAELDPDELRAARLLATTRLLALTDDDRVELAHEALIAHWPRLVRLIADRRAFLDWRESLRYDLERWTRAGAPPDLLPNATALAAARQWLPGHAADLAVPERDYLRRGHRRQRARTRGRRAWLTAAVLLLVTAVTAGALLVSTRRESDERRALAESRALALAAQDVVGSDPALSVMTALAAYRRSPTREARDQLLQHRLRHATATRVLSGAPGPLATAETSRDGDVVLTVTDVGRTTLTVHAATGEVRNAEVPVQHVLYALVAPDGKRAAFVEDDGDAGWFEVRPDAERIVGQVRRLPRAVGLKAFTQHPHDSAAISADGGLVAVTTGDRLLWWDLDAGTVAGTAPLPLDAGNGLWFGADDRTLLVKTFHDVGAASAEGLVAADLATGEVRSVLDPVVDRELLVSGDRTGVVTCRRDESGGRVQLLRVADGIELGAAIPTTRCALVSTDATGHRTVVREDGLVLVDLGAGAVVSDVVQRAAERPVAFLSGLVESGGDLLLGALHPWGVTYTTLPTGNQVLDADDGVLTPDGAGTVTRLTDGRLQLRPSGEDSGSPLAEHPGTPPLAPRLREHLLAVDPSGELLVNRTGEHEITVHQLPSLRELTRITAVAHPPDPSGKDVGFTYHFDRNGGVVTVSGTVVQQWDARRGEELARFDAKALLPPGAPPSALAVAPYPLQGHVAVLVREGTTAHVIELATGRTTGTVEVPPYTYGLQFDPSGRYFAVLRTGTAVELWRRDPHRRELGIGSSLSSGNAAGWRAGFLDDEGRYLVAANNAVRVYRIGDKAPVDSYEFAFPDSGNHHFVDVSADGGTVLYQEVGAFGGPGGPGGALALDPVAWQRDLCRVIGDRAFTEDERDALPPGVDSLRVCR